MADFHVKIISSNRTFYEGVCHCLILPAVDGEMAVMAHHESEIVAVKAGEMRFQATEDGPWEAAVVGQGFCEIANNRVMLLADTIEKPEEIDRIYINFCDPWPRKKNAKRRLTYHTFLEKYKYVLKLGGEIHFKTDNAKLFDWSLPEMESCFLKLRNVTDDLHANGPVGIMTGYEEKFYALGTPIHRVEAVVVTKQPRPADEKPEKETDSAAEDEEELN